MQLRIVSQIEGKIKHGVPQGSVLGAVAFHNIKYINDLPPTINTF
jgi:hypothetical protein